MKRLFVLILFLFLLGGATSVQAQGNDFPFYPNFPPTSQPFVPGPVPGTDCCVSGTAWGPQILWGVQKGDIIHFDIVMDWYGLVPLSLSPRVESAVPGSMQYLEGNSGVPQRRQWVWP